MIDDDEILAEFITESRENLDSLDEAFVSLERDPTDRGVLAGIFRTVHTLKGTAGFLGLERLERASHAGESLLAKLRDGQLTLDGDMTTALLQLVDIVRVILDGLEGGTGEADVNVVPLVAELNRLQTDEPAPKAAVVEAVVAPVVAPAAKPRRSRAGTGTRGNAAPAVTATPVATGPTIDPQVVVTAALAAPDGVEDVEEAVESVEPTLRAERPRGGVTANVDSGKVLIGELLTEAGLVSDAAVDAALAIQRGGDRRRLGEILVDSGELSVDALTEALADQENKRVKVLTPTVGALPSGARKAPEVSVRVDVEVLDGLVDLVGQLVLSRNRLIAQLNDSDRAALEAAALVDRVTSRLQEQVLKTRVQPIRTAWAKLPRIVRDLSLSCGKQIRLEMEGEDTELDRSVIDSIKDPLVHIVRNSIDHGIEDPILRRQRGKDPEGLLKLAAYHDAGEVVVEIRDDGNGMDPNKMREKAVEKGLMSFEEAERLSDTAALEIVFLPGFSTAAKVTNLSGRGVGMDVVKTSIEATGGRVELSSVFGKGTLLTLRLPLTLAILPALLVRVQGNRFAVPQAQLLELVRLRPGGPQLEPVGDGATMFWRSQLLPVLDLSALVSGQRVSGEVRARRSEGVVAVIQSAGRRYGIRVDKVETTEEVVVKPLGRHVSKMHLYAGATVLGDGSVCLIMDLAGLARLGSVDDTASGPPVQDAMVEAAPTVLVTQAGDRKVGLELSSVKRLHLVPADAVDLTAQVVKLDNRLLRLHLTNHNPSFDRGKARIVVADVDGEEVAVLVDRILDAADESTARKAGDGYGRGATTLVQGSVVDMLSL